MSGSCATGSPRCSALRAEGGAGGDAEVEDRRVSEEADFGAAAAPVRTRFWTPTTVMLPTVQTMHDGGDAERPPPGGAEPGEDEAGGEHRVGHASGCRPGSGRRSAPRDDAERRRQMPKAKRITGRRSWLTPPASMKYGATKVETLQNAVMCRTISA